MSDLATRIDNLEGTCYHAKRVREDLELVKREFELQLGIQESENERVHDWKRDIDRRLANIEALLERKVGKPRKGP